ncbi:MAG: CBS domain-containing protein [Desulfobacteraceae bacterium]|nr:CBS domain-containing protein [Desulfobacteraceae bacterium]
MKTRQVKDLMTPEKEFVRINESLSVPEAIVALKNAIKGYVEKNYLYDCVLVENSDGVVLGKISAVDIIKALEPKYSRTGDSDAFSKKGVPHFGLSPEYVKTIVSRYNLWDESLEDMVRHSAKLKASDIMYSPSDGGHVYETSSMADAIHQMALNHHTSVIVEKDNQITGVIRLMDIFKEVCNRVEKNQ